MVGGWRLADNEREASRHAVLRRRNPDDDLRVYAYGSLMWDPGIHFSEVRLARLDGYQRCFGYRTTGGRGTPERPGLMLTLVRQPGSCIGLAFRVPAELADAESAILWRREMVRGGYAPQWHRMLTPQGDVQALLFAANCNLPEYLGELPLDRTAAMVAAASGPLGSNRYYLLSLSAQLAALGIHDAYISALSQRVQSLGRRD